jgi:hypothetical protein
MIRWDPAAAFARSRTSYPRAVAGNRAEDGDGSPPNRSAALTKIANVLSLQRDHNHRTFRTGRVHCDWNRKQNSLSPPNPLLTSIAHDTQTCAFGILSWISSIRIKNKLKGSHANSPECTIRALEKVDPAWNHTQAARSCVPNLIDDLKNPSVLRRRIAAILLGQIGDTGAVEPLCITSA